jgi:hypothetical protein
VRIALRPNIVGVLLSTVGLGFGAAGVIAVIIDAIATDNVPYGPAGWIVALLVIPLCAVVALFLFAHGANVLLRFVLPERITSQGDTLRVRVETRYWRRSDARFPRADLAFTELRAWQHGLREVWVVHRSGAAFRVANGSSLEEAESLRAQIQVWISEQDLNRKTGSQEG